MADTEFYHTTEWGSDKDIVYNCNFCPFDTLDLKTINAHIAQDHEIDIFGNRLGLRGPQYVPSISVKEEKKLVVADAMATGDN